MCPITSPALPSFTCACLGGGSNKGGQVPSRRHEHLNSHLDFFVLSENQLKQLSRITKNTTSDGRPFYFHLFFDRTSAPVQEPAVRHSSCLFFPGGATCPCSAHLCPFSLFQRATDRVHYSALLLPSGGLNASDFYGFAVEQKASCSDADAVHYTLAHVLPSHTFFAFCSPDSPPPSPPHLYTTISSRRSIEENDQSTGNDVYAQFPFPFLLL